MSESLLESFYTKWLRPGDVCVDVGAHVGRHTLPMAAAVGPRGHVIAFEPIPFAADALANSIRALPAPHCVDLRRNAVADEPGRTEFVVAVDRPEESGLRERVRYNGSTRLQRIAVDVATLDAAIPRDERICFVKIDVEGGEFGVLKGADDLLRRDFPLIAFEFGASVASAYGTSAQSLFDWLAQRGYVLFDLRGHRLSREAFCERSGLEMLWDYLAVPEGDAIARAQSLLRDNYRATLPDDATPPTSDEAFIRQCYSDLLGREADSAGFSHYLERLQHHGWTREEIAATFRLSDEYRRRNSAAR
jgi:FkbM family methyltransferase